MYTSCMLCWFLPRNIFALTYLKKKYISLQENPTSSIPSKESLNENRWYILQGLMRVHKKLKGFRNWMML